MRIPMKMNISKDLFLKLVRTQEWMNGEYQSGLVWGSTKIWNLICSLSSSGPGSPNKWLSSFQMSPSGLNILRDDVSIVFLTSTPQFLTASSYWITFVMCLSQVGIFIFFNCIFGLCLSQVGIFIARKVFLDSSLNGNVFQAQRLS